MQKWKNGRKIIAINQSINSNLRDRFYRRVLQASPTTKFFTTGSPVPFKTKVVKTEKSALKFTASLPDTIAYVSFKMVDESVKVISINGMKPSEPGYEIH